MSSFRNLAGVRVTNVTQLNLLHLAPGGHVGRFIIWTQAAFDQLNTIFGTADKPSAVKSGYFLPRPILSNPDVRRVLMADTIQSAVVHKHVRSVKTYRPNFLTNKRAMARVNPYASLATAGVTSRSKARFLAATKKGDKKPVKKDRKGKKKAFHGATFKKNLFTKYHKVVHSQ